MEKLEAIERKIIGLKRQMEEIRQKTATLLYKKLEAEMEDSFSPEVVLGMVMDLWSSSSPEKRKLWREKGERFFRNPPRKENRENQKTHRQDGTKMHKPEA